MVALSVTTVVTDAFHHNSDRWRHYAVAAISPFIKWHCHRQCAVWLYCEGNREKNSCKCGIKLNSQ